MDWQAIAIPLVELFVFMMPIFGLIYNMGKRQQNTEDRITHSEEDIKELRQSHNAMYVMLSNIQTSITRLETKVELHFNLSNIDKLEKK